MDTNNPFIVIDGKYITISPFNVRALKGYEIPKDDKSGKELPNCCGFHKSIYANCLNNFKDLPNMVELTRKVVLQVSYTEYHISKKIIESDWFDDITDYIAYNVNSFGHPNTGANLYIESINYWVEKVEPVEFEFPAFKRKKLLDFIHATFYSQPIKKHIDLNLLHQTYQKWVQIFPFNISYFTELKKHFEGRMPFLKGKPSVNRYTGIAKVQVVTIEEMGEQLLNNTKNLLKQINVEVRKVKDINQHTIEIINERHRIEQEALLTNFSVNETQYVELLKKWLSNEATYFKEVSEVLGNSLTQNEVKQIESKETILRKGLEQYGFLELPLIKPLTESNQTKLISFICKGKLPYAIAMLDFLGFIKNLTTNYSKSNYNLYKILSKLLNGGKNERLIKGNVAVLSDKSNEDKSRYTAYKHKETVINDYQQLK